LHETHFAEQLHDLQREAIGLIHFGGDRSDVSGNHFPDTLAERDLFFSEAHEWPDPVRKAKKKLSFNG
jgi:hypothetical protein